MGLIDCQSSSSTAVSAVAVPMDVEVEGRSQIAKKVWKLAHAPNVWPIKIPFSGTVGLVGNWMPMPTAIVLILQSPYGCMCQLQPLWFPKHNRILYYINLSKRFSWRHAVSTDLSIGSYIYSLTILSSCANTGKNSWNREKEKILKVNFNYFQDRKNECKLFPKILVFWFPCSVVILVCELLLAFTKIYSQHFFFFWKKC